MKKPLRVLIVEDVADDADLVDRQLRQAGYATATRRVQDAEGMRAALEGDQWDLVVSDYSMPQFDAPSALRLLRQSGRDIPFIVVSGSIGEDVAVAMMKAGAHDYVLKDNLTRFASAVERELQEAENRRERKLAEHWLRVSDHALKAVSQGVLISGPDRLLLSANEAFTAITGYGQAEVLGRSCRFLQGPATDPETTQAIRRCLAELRDFSGEILNYRKDGTTFWNDLSISPVRDDSGRLTHFIGIIRDTTDRRRTGEALRDSLREKEALLQEVHHRVKNNLQVISSLLRLETSRTEDAGAQRVLKDMQGRVLSMALLHETLYRTGRFGAVDLGPYLKHLAQQLIRTLQSDSALGRLVLELASVEVDIDQAIPCGLILNELLTNSLKHGLAHGRGGEVRVVLEADASAAVRLQVSDNGAGLPPDFEMVRSKSLGLQLVTDLARQLGGRLEVGPEPRAIFTVIFTPARTHRTNAALRRPAPVPKA